MIKFENPFVTKEVSMIITKSGKFKVLRFIGVFCAIIMGFMTLVGTSEDDADDIIDIDFDAEAEVELDPVTVTQASGASIQIAGSDCGTISINGALEELEDEIENLDEVDIDSVDFDYISGTYSDVQWTPNPPATITCSLTITGTQSTTIAETVINGSDGNIDNTLTPDQIAVLNYYLDNRNEEFTYCVTCTDTELTTYSVTYNVDIGIIIEGTI